MKPAALAAAVLLAAWRIRERRRRYRAWDGHTLSWQPEQPLPRDGYMPRCPECRRNHRPHHPLCATGRLAGGRR